MLSVGPKILRYITKVISQSLQLFYVLMKLDDQAFILLQVFYTSDVMSHDVFSVALRPRFLSQNPPGLPSIVVTWLASRLIGAQFVIDWHNYGYSIMALSHGEKHPIVRVAKWYWTQETFTLSPMTWFHKYSLTVFCQV